MEAPFWPPVSAGLFWCLVFDVCPTVRSIRRQACQQTGPHAPNHDRYESNGARRFARPTIDNIRGKIADLRRHGFADPVKMITSSPTILDEPIASTFAWRF
jgi:hypothetical protein